ncbi:hypothetical protein VNO78_27421 [Psophocarpus tetragonolobus]|uniref:Uncharacterized protein n=1 Tax=Psophocarpus tetragonolobus TaxID=3891 RepID=A0AAN9S0Q9_PSOTE
MEKLGKNQKENVEVNGQACIHLALQCQIIIGFSDSFKDVNLMSRDITQGSPQDARLGFNVIPKDGQNFDIQ